MGHGGFDDPRHRLFLLLALSRPVSRRFPVFERGWPSLEGDGSTT